MIIYLATSCTLYKELWTLTSHPLHISLVKQTYPSDYQIIQALTRVLNVYPVGKIGKTHV